MKSYQRSSILKNVRYEIRGKLERLAQDMEHQGHEIIRLNIGNPGLFGFRAPESLRYGRLYCPNIAQNRYFTLEILCDTQAREVSVRGI